MNNGEVSGFQDRRSKLFLIGSNKNLRISSEERKLKLQAVGSSKSTWIKEIHKPKPIVKKPNPRLLRIKDEYQSSRKKNRSKRKTLL